MLLGVHGARASIGQRFRQFGEFFIPVRQVGHARYRCRLLVDAPRSRLGLVPVGRNHTSRNGAMRAKSSIDTGNADVDRHHARPFTALVVLALPPLWGPALTVPNEPPPLVLEFGQELEFG